jgi:hypothetical protein
LHADEANMGLSMGAADTPPIHCISELSKSPYSTTLNELS